jgi:hypothetical protein|tara:strand:+ start:142 stop:396 length:255 start_codon:yes stop_codon:yes gene_type:complete
MSEEKRYRFQVQFDIYADSDKQAVDKVKDILHNLPDAQSEFIIYMAENYFASLSNRIIDYESIEVELEKELEVRLKDIQENLPF